MMIAKAEKEVFVEALLKGTYYSVLSDGSTDNSTQEQELVLYFLFNKGVWYKMDQPQVECYFREL